MKQPILIGVIGVTGAGKTTFISRASGRTDLVIGYDLDSCTRDITSVPFKVDGREIILIDTPGFDDTDRSEAHVLEQIANYLHTTYTANYLLTGLILLQPINGNRITGSEMRRTQLFKKILGPNAYERVIIGTTMWNKIAEESSGTMNAVGRQQRNDVWGDMVERGARVMRHDDNRESALRLIRELTKFNTPVALQMQEELSQNGGRIAMTSAGRQLDDDLSVEVNNLREEIAKLQSERIDVQKEIQELRDKLTRVEADRFRLGRMTTQIIELILQATPHIVDAGLKCVIL